MEIAKKDIKDQIEKMLDDETNHVYKLALENMLAIVDMYSNNDDLINNKLKLLNTRRPQASYLN